MPAGWAVAGRTLGGTEICTGARTPGEMPTVVEVVEGVDGATVWQYALSDGR
ncbi:hypothetical protein V3N99_11710 [Dermatophilaceae bacterium Soc4.6]